MCLNYANHLIINNKIKYEDLPIINSLNKDKKGNEKYLIHNDKSKINSPHELKDINIGQARLFGPSKCYISTKYNEGATLNIIKSLHLKYDNKKIYKLIILNKDGCKKNVKKSAPAPSPEPVPEEVPEPEEKTEPEKMVEKTKKLKFDFSSKLW